MGPKIKYSSKFNDDWLNINDHPTCTWLARVVGDNSKARCNVCTKHFDVNNMGMWAVTSHENGQKHKMRCDLKPKSVAIKLHFRPTCQTSSDTSDTGAAQEPSTSSVCTLATEPPVETSSTECVPASVESASNAAVASVGHKPAAMSNFLIKDNVTKAEIIWALNGIMCHTSLRGASNAADLFPLMFPDSDIASRFRMQKDKNSYVVTYGLCPFFQEELASCVQKCAFFAVSFDESLNKVAQKGQMGEMDIIVRFWNRINEVSTCYLTLNTLNVWLIVLLLN